MKKALIDVKRINNDVITTSTCNAVIEDYDRLIQYNGTITGSGPYNMGASNYYKYISGNWEKQTGSIAYTLYFNNPSILITGKWYHYDTSESKLFECPDPESHNLPE